MSKNVVIGFVWLLCVACGGAEPTAEPEPTLANIQAAIFEPGCATAGCHVPDVSAGGLDLSSLDATYEALVDQPVSNSIANENGWLRVKPFEPNRSFLMRKLVGPGVGEGGPMPNSDQVLSDEYLQLIERWINEGATK